MLLPSLVFPFFFHFFLSSFPLPPSLIQSLLGYPIINDPLYDNPAWGPGRGKKGEKERDLNDVQLTL